MELIEKSIASIKPLNDAVFEQANERLANQARPAGSLGLLEPASARLAAIFGTLDVRLDNKVIITCAGDHGVTEEGVSLFPQEVTPQMVFNFVNGGASINVLGRHAGARVIAADLGVNYDFEPDLPIFHKKVGKGTANFARVPAMSREDAERSVAAGIEIVTELIAEGPVNMLGTGDMGIGNTTPSSAVIAAFSGIAVERLTGRGTGIDDAALANKIRVIEQALALHRPDPADPLDVLAKVGGFRDRRAGRAGDRRCGGRHPRGVRRADRHRRRPDRLRTGTRGQGVPVCQPPVGGGGAPLHARTPGGRAPAGPSIPVGGGHGCGGGHGTAGCRHPGAVRHQDIRRSGHRGCANQEITPSKQPSKDLMRNNRRLRR